MANSFNRRTLFTALVALLFATVATAQERPSKHGLSAVPSNAAAYVHFDLVKLCSAPGMTVPGEIAAGVKQEADMVFEKHLGVRISELQSVTYVIPTFESAMALASNDPPTGFGLFAFSKPVKENAIGKSLPGSWKRTKIGSHVMLVDQDSGNAVFQSSPTTIAFGSEASVRWFIKFRAFRSDSGLRPTMKMADYGHITIGINGDVIPSEMKSFLPSEFKSIASAKSAGIGIDLANGTAARAKIVFANEADAAGSAALVKSSIQNALDRLKLEEANTVGQIKAGHESLFEAMEPLSMLAMFRFGDKVIRSTKIEQNGTQLNVHVEVKGFDGHMMALVSLTAIQAIGTSSEASFQEIADELDAANELNSSDEKSAKEEFEELRAALEAK